MADINCKKCSSGNCVKNGTVRGKARWLCKDCRYNFVLGDARVHTDLVAKKALAVIMYSVSKSSYGMLGRLFGVSALSFIAGYVKLQISCQNLQCPVASKKWSLTKCGISSAQKKQNMDHQSVGS